jgi:phosphate transport system protein
MHRHFDDKMEQLRNKLLRMATLVEEAISKSVRSLVERDSELARQVIEGDDELDRLEIDVDRFCVELLGLQQPMARDLRFITTAIKINTDLERMGDLAANVSERAIELNQEPPLKPYIDIPLMAERAQKMVRGALDAYFERNPEKARQVIAMDDELDDRMEQIFRELLSFMLEDPRTISRALPLTFIAKYLERIGDQATNICEQVVFMTEGAIIKHPGVAGAKEEGMG